MSDIHDLRAQYRQSVQDMAEECVRLVREDDYELGDAVHYYVDDCEWVIYTFKNHIVLLESNNSHAVEEMGFGEIKDLSQMLMIAAYCAVEADVLEYIEENNLLGGDDD